MEHGRRTSLAEDAIQSAEGQSEAEGEFGSSRGVSAPLRLRARLRYQAGARAIAADFSLSTQRTVLFGPSGSGKSTILRLLAGLMPPAAGTISLNGVMLTDTSAGLAVPAGRRGIGYVTQEPALFPHLSVEANIGYGLRWADRALGRVRLATMLALFSLEPLARRYPSRLSGGERQRVALARALAPEPSLLLLDEPFAGLDARRKDETSLALEQYLSTRETTVLSVSHDLADVYASSAANRVDVLLLEEGRITARGLAVEVLAPQRERLLRQLGAGGL